MLLTDQVTRFIAAKRLLMAFLALWEHIGAQNTSAPQHFCSAGLNDLIDCVMDLAVTYEVCAHPWLSDLQRAWGQDFS